MHKYKHDFPTFWVHGEIFMLFEKASLLKAIMASQQLYLEVFTSTELWI